MATIINANTSGGLIQTADTSGILQLQTAGVTGMQIDASQNATFYAGLNSPYIYMREQQASGTQGGASVATTWQTRVLNTKVFDTGNMCTLSANQFVLTAGTYYISAKAPCFGAAQYGKLRLYNVTGSATVIVGSNDYSASTGSAQCKSFLTGRFTVTASQTLALQHYIAVAQATNGLGVGATSGELEIYTEVELWRIS